MWTVIYMARSKDLIVKIQGILADAGMSVRIRSMGNEDIDGYFEILVPESAAQTAHLKLIRFGY